MEAQPSGGDARVAELEAEVRRLTAELQAATEVDGRATEVDGRATGAEEPPRETIANPVRASLEMTRIMTDEQREAHLASPNTSRMTARQSARPEQMQAESIPERSRGAVSYTHLTLPTILLV